MKLSLDSILFRDLLDEGEEIIYVAHVHPFIVFPQFLKLIILGLITPALFYVLFPMIPEAWLGWGAIGLLWFSYELIQWYLDAWIITNIAVINYDWDTPFTKTTNRIEYGNIDSITNEVNGFWATILGFGNIRIDYTSTPIVLENVSRPKKIERIIVENQAKFVASQTEDDHTRLKELLTTLLRSTIRKG